METFKELIENNSSIGDQIYDLKMQLTKIWKENYLKNRNKFKNVKELEKMFNMAFRGLDDLAEFIWEEIEGK
jgi:hypothetical protein